MNQKPDIHVGTVLSIGTVTDILSDRIVLDYKGSRVTASLISAAKVFEDDQKRTGK